MTRLWAYIVNIAIVALVFTVVIVALFLAIEGAAWFAWGSDRPATPWFLVRFFLFLSWVLAVPAGAIAAFESGQPTENTHTSTSEKD